MAVPWTPVRWSVRTWGADSILSIREAHGWTRVATSSLCSWVGWRLTATIDILVGLVLWDNGRLGGPRGSHSSLNGYLYIELGEGTVG